ncbi:hypothetical protein ACIBFB_08460 [Nocardiopsis sp. NPDC050513]|uniref:hypothetical protein n=1 Tax=Nocardiopsis sp. NPDC050513 TaxID=3364338 RepID=UPI003791B10A
MTERILSAVDECLDWARGLDPPVDVDVNALVFLLGAHRDAGAPDPGDWTTADVHDIAGTVRDWDRVPDNLRDTWLTWCDHLVERGGLLSCESPRRLRAAISAVDLTPGGPPATADPIDEAALPLLDRLGVGDGGEAEPLPPIAPARAADLDAAARPCRPLSEAARLTAWVGGGRPLDPDRPHDALTGPDTDTAADVLRIPPDAVPRVLRVAREAGLLRTTYTRVLRGRAARAWERGTPGAAADAWADALLAMTGARGMTAFLILTDLFVSGRPRTPDRLVEVFGAGVALGPCPGRPCDDVRSVLDALVGLGAVERTGGDSYRVTPLGDHFVVRQLRRSGAEVPLTPPVRDMGADHVLTLLEQGRPVDTEELMARWLTTRDPHTAARELLEASADPRAWHRRHLVAATLAGLGIDLTPVLRMYVHHPVLGGWARRLRGTHTEVPTSHQVVWAVLDSYAILVEAGSPLPDRDRDRYAACAEQLTRTMWLTGHPAAGAVLDRLADGALGEPLAEAARRVRPVGC